MMVTYAWVALRLTLDPKVANLILTPGFLLVSVHVLSLLDLVFFGFSNFLNPNIMTIGDWLVYIAPRPQ